MKIHLRSDGANGRHTRVTVFIDGANCGQLTLLEKDAIALHLILMNGVNPVFDSLKSSGEWVKEGRDG